MAISPDLISGISQGVSNVGEYRRDTSNREARQAEAKLIQQRANSRIQNNVPQQAANLEAEQLKQELKTLQANSLKRSTYEAFDRFTADGDINHINTFLADARKNPAGAKLYSNMLRLDPLSNNPETRAQLGQMGVDNIDDYLANPELANSKAVATLSDGTQKVLDLNKIFALTGYTDYMGAKKLEQLNQRVAIDRLIAGPQSAETNLIRQMAEEQGISLTKAAQQFYTNKRASTGQGRGSALERLANTLMEEDPSLTLEDATRRAKAASTSGTMMEREARRVAEAEGKDYQETFTELKQNEERTNKRKQLDEAESVRGKIDEIAGGDFLSLDKVDDMTRRKVGRYVTELETLTGKPLTSDDKKEVRKLRNLMELGGKAGDKLTEADTGFIDATLKNVKKYFIDDATGTEASSAYQTFANSLRNTLYGATLTAAEIEAFRAASGSLKQQLKPALAGLKTQLGTVQENLKSIYDLNDEYVAQYYLGTSLSQMEKVMDSIDQRLDFFNELEQSQVVRAQVPIAGQDSSSSSSTPTRRPLNEIFGSKQ